MSTTSTLSKIIIGLVTVALALGAFFGLSQVPQAQALESLSSIQAGDLIRGESFSAVYYMGEDGFRYVFPNDKAYFTWYDNFDTVKFIADTDLAKVQIGGNVTYKPGSKMIKINTDPATYAVAAGGTLRHVTSETIATSLFGSDWNQQIDDVPDSFFANYTIGDPIESESDYDASSESAAATSINTDKGLLAPAEISVTDSGYSPIDVTIEVGQGVKFTNNSSENHSATGDNLTWGTGTLAPGGSYIRSFDEAGDYGFFDSYDSANTGAVIVE